MLIDQIYLVLSIIGGFIAICFIIWNSSRKLTNIEDRVDNLETKLDSHIEDSEGAESNVYSKLKELRDEFRQDINESKKFFIDWIQRLENVTRDTRPPINMPILSGSPDKLDEIIKLLKEMKDN